MKYLFILLLLPSTLSAQKNDTVEMMRIDSTGKLKHWDRIVVWNGDNNAAMKTIIMWDEAGGIIVRGDSLTAIKMLIENIKKYQVRQSQFEDFVRSTVDFTSQLPEKFKLGLAWERYIDLRKHYGWYRLNLKKQK